MRLNMESFIANHQSNLDIVAMLKAIKKPHGYIAKKELDKSFY